MLNFTIKKGGAMVAHALQTEIGEKTTRIRGPGVSQGYLLRQHFIAPIRSITDTHILSTVLWVQKS